MMKCFNFFQVLTVLGLLWCGALESFAQQKPPVWPQPVANQDFSPGGHYAGPLVIPSIARFKTLPMRMDFEPEIQDVPTYYLLDAKMVALCTRALKESADEEIQEVAALQLYRVAFEKLDDISPAKSTLMERLTSSASRRVRRACACALAAGGFEEAAEDLTKFVETSADADRVIVEPVLAAWKAPSAQELWRKRIADPLSSATATKLAAAGLIACGDTENGEKFVEMAGNSQLDFLKRQAAARAAAILAPEKAAALGKTLTGNDEPSRLLAMDLLDSSLPDALEAATKHTNDPASPVASAAWQLVFRHKPELLQPSLAEGRSYKDATVRMMALRVMRQFPDAQRSTWLNEQMSDIHISVRNVAREMLLAVATEKPDLRNQIVNEAIARLNPESKDWQSIEQSLLLLGQLRATEYSALCLPLLNYPRSEVRVTAAWLIHLYPDVAVRDAVVKATVETQEQLADPAQAAYENGLKQTFLFQYCGIMRIKEVEELYNLCFDKGAPAPRERRGAAMWSLGLLYERNPDPGLIARLEERIKDRSSPNPEIAQVRRMALAALGFMRATAAQPTFEEALEIDPVSGKIKCYARWAYPLVGLPAPADLDPLPSYVGGWRLNPAE